MAKVPQLENDTDGINAAKVAQSERDKAEKNGKLAQMEDQIERKAQEIRQLNTEKETLILR